MAVAYVFNGLFRTNRLAWPPLPKIVTLLDAFIDDVVVIDPCVLMTVEPVINEALFIVPAVMIGLVNVLFVRVAVPTSVSTSPELGNVAVDDMPIPPLIDCRIPLTALAFARFKDPKYGVPPVFDTVRTE